MLVFLFGWGLMRLPLSPKTLEFSGLIVYNNNRHTEGGSVNVNAKNPKQQR